MNAKFIIEKVLSYQDEDIWLSCDEIASQCRAMGVYKGTSGNSVGSRLPEMKLKGIVDFRWREREGCKYKEWQISANHREQMIAERMAEAAENAREAAQESAGLDSLGRGPK